MKEMLLLGGIIASIANSKAQVKLYNVDLPYFNKSNLVKAAKTVKSATNIIQYNAMGQLHGINIEYRRDASVGLIRYYHNNRLVYAAQAFMNGSAMQKVYNYSDNGSYNGMQVYTFLDSSTNKWSKTEFMYHNGRLVSINDKLKFPNYTLNFKEGKLEGEFYFYDSLHCSCYYYGFAKEGKPKMITKIEIGEDLSFRNTFYELTDKSIKSTTIFDYRKPIEENLEITEVPVIVENKNVHLDNDHYRIVFDKQHDWMLILRSREFYNDNTMDEIDWSETSFGVPSPYTLPQKQH